MESEVTGKWVEVGCQGAPENADWK